MAQNLRPGHAGMLTETVTPEKSAAAVGSGLLPVYSTPSMIALMEKTASAAVEPFLGPGQVTVGSEIHVRHKKASAIGSLITCRARLHSVEENRLQFDVEAYDENQLIGEGTHIRYIVDRERFMNKLKK
jgi:fluoroacetyl-CoA thioesterase